MRYIDLGAIVSACGAYRYRLWRRWDDSLPTMVWIMLNPSTADGETDDATIRTIVEFAQRWGCGGIEVVNLFAYRATDPKDLKAAGYPVGPQNGDHLRAMIGMHTHFMAAWGANANCAAGRAMIHCLAKLWDEALEHSHKELSALKITKSGMPSHPLYIARSQERVHFDFRSVA